MHKIAMVQNGVVVNIAVWDGVSFWEPPSTFDLIDVTSETCDIGWTWDGSKLSPGV